MGASLQKIRYWAPRCAKYLPYIRSNLPYVIWFQFNLEEPDFNLPANWTYAVCKAEAFDEDDNLDNACGVPPKMTEEYEDWWAERGIELSRGGCGGPYWITADLIFEHRMRWA